MTDTTRSGAAPAGDPFLPALPTGSAVLDQAWRAFWTSVGEARETIYTSPLYGHSPETRTQGNHLLHQLLYVGHVLAVQPQQLYPTFFGHPFQWPQHNTYGLPSPDNTFGICFLDGTRRYRLHGRRNTVHNVRMVLYHGFWGDPNPAQMAELELDDFAIGPDGSFEIVLSADPVEGNWLQIDGASRNVPLMVRQNHLDWETEVRAELHIERLDLDDDRPQLVLDEAQVAQRIATAGRIITHMANLARFADRLVLPAVGGAYNSFTDLSGPNITTFGTFNHAHYVNAVYQCGLDEALVVTVPEVADADYWNVQVGDIWYQSEDYVYHQTSLNVKQSTRDADGFYRFVIAHRDPGVANWIDASGRTFGLLVWRIYGPPGAVPVPAIERVALAEVDAMLPAGTLRCTPDERRAALRRRHEASKRRWGL
ncbi:MAG TPA: DUF1214 domain-containing protein [Novosphingobium sp.]